MWRLRAHSCFGDSLEESHLGKLTWQNASFSSSVLIGVGSRWLVWFAHRFQIKPWTSGWNIDFFFFLNIPSLKPQRRQWHPTPVLLPGNSHGWRSLVGCSPWGWEESDTTERFHFHFSLSYIGEGNGNPLQCSCLENPREGGAWWAAIYGVAQRRTRLELLSSPSSSSLKHVCPWLQSPTLGFAEHHAW